MNIKKTSITALFLVLILFVAMAGQYSQEAVAEEVTIRLWAAWGVDSGPDIWIEEFESQYPDINVEYVQYPNTDEGNIRLDTALTVGDKEIDVFFNYGVRRLVPRTNLVEPLNQIMEADEFNVEEEIVGQHYTEEDIYYGLPVTAINDAVYINQDALERAGLEVPESWTLEEYREYARELTEGEGLDKVYGGSTHDALYYWQKPARGYFGSDAWYNKEGMSNFDHEAFRKSLEHKIQAELEEEIQFPYSDMTAQGMHVFTVMHEGYANMAPASSAMARFLNNMEEYPRDFDVTVAPWPKLYEDQDENYNRGLQTFSYLSMREGMEEERQEAAWKFMKWLATEGNVLVTEVGHMPTWANVDTDEVIDGLIGEAKDTIDLEAYKRVVLDFESPSFVDTHFVAYEQINVILEEEAEAVLYEQKTMDEAIQNMKERADNAINEELED